ncbi:MAG: RecQ family ATP-dependent DNA helicase [Bacteroidia bacterium]|nr:RecQ family ATP-dependent DNA helicase [Bacteroidia bacterium]
MNTPAEILKRYWGYDVFRPSQLEIIESVLAGNDTLGLLPTGGGKSICFQVPAMMLDGVCIVVTPLIALMKDQVENLQSKGIEAVALHTGMGWRELELELENTAHGKYKFLYVSPERLKSTKFLNYLRSVKICLLAIDEAHCISQWGYDFRPEYLKISEFRMAIKKTAVIALTASATAVVVNDIQDRLSFRNNKVFVNSFVRSNLAYVIQNVENKREKMADICKKVEGTGIVYVRNRKGTKDISEFLKGQGISSDHYHAGLSNDERSRKQNEWKQGITRVMVCTNAFGMGIDKPEVRFVIHEEKPESLEAYYQEAGRAGRDGEKAFCVLLNHKGDHLDDAKKIEERYPPPETINKIYQGICSYLNIATGSGENISYDFDVADFATRYNLGVVQVHHAISLLASQNYLSAAEAIFTPSKMRISIDYSELQELQTNDSGADNFFKLLIRSYAGIFDHYTPVNESDLAKRAKVTPAKIIATLNKYHKAGIIDYQPKKDKPTITLLENRYPSIRINERELEFLKGRYVERLDKVMQYVNNLAFCRSALLVKYFGETDASDCGICDICLGRKKAVLGKDRFNVLMETIKTEVLNKTLNMRSLTQIVPEGEVPELLTVARWLLDNKLMVAGKNGEITWKKDKN